MGVFNRQQAEVVHLPPYVVEVDAATGQQTFYSPLEPMNGVGKDGDIWCRMDEGAYIQMCVEAMKNKGGRN